MYIAGYLLPTDDRYREHHDHIWIVMADIGKGSGSLFLTNKTCRSKEVMVNNIKKLRILEI